MSSREDTRFTPAQEPAPLKTLEELRQELSRGLASAFEASCPQKLGEDLAQRAARQALEGHELPGDFLSCFGEAPLCSLICFDANSIQGFVFESEKVPVASGASEILEDLNAQLAAPFEPLEDAQGQRLVDLLPEICGVLYSAGGGGILFAPGQALPGRPQPWQVAAELEAILGHRGHGLTFTVVTVPLFAKDFRPGREDSALKGPESLGLHRFAPVEGFRGALVQAQIELQAKKDQGRPLSVADLTVGPGQLTAARCASCGARPPADLSAVEAASSPDYKKWCPVCRRKRGAYKKSEAEGEASPDRGPVTFEDLAEVVERSRRYLAFLALDGNSMGQVVRGVRNFLQLRAFSEATTHIYAVARHRVAEVLERGYLRKELPARPGSGDSAPWPVDPRQASLSLLSGGDEITLVLGAAMAPAVALMLVKAVEEGFEEATQPNCLLGQAFADAPQLLERLRGAGVGVGLVMASPKYPVRLLRQYAGDLQKQAKKHGAARGFRSAIAWTLLTDSAALTERLRIAEGAEVDAPRFATLLQAAEAAQRIGLPQSALQTLLSFRAHEAYELSQLGDEADRRQVLDRLSAHFLRYQMARNEPLAAWMGEVLRPNSMTVQAVTLEAVTVAATLAFFEKRQGHRFLEQTLDLLSLEPFPRTEPDRHRDGSGATQEDAA